VIAQGIEVSFRTSSPVGAAPATHGRRILPFKETSFDEGSQTTQGVLSDIWLPRRQQAGGVQMHQHRHQEMTYQIIRDCTHAYAIYSSFTQEYPF
jgi:hypothetical protein